MAKKKKRKFKRFYEERKKRFALPQEIKQMIFGVVLILLAVLVGLSFFDKAGKGGKYFMEGSIFLLGKTVFLIPLIFILGGIILLTFRKEREFFKKEARVSWPVILAVFLSILGVTGILAIFSPELRKGGWLGFLISWPLLKFLGFWATQIIFIGLIIISVLIFWYFLGKFRQKEKTQIPSTKDKTWEDKPSIIKKIFTPKFRVEEVPGFEKAKGTEFLQEKELGSLKPLPLSAGSPSVERFSYQPPPLKLLEADQDVPTSGDTKINSAIIRKTLQNFGIEVAMSEINIGPTVTQYTFKPAEGVKLSKITALSNDLSLALASHPIRIEAPIPSRSLVGIEVPNKGRAQVRLRNLIENPIFQKSLVDLMIVLGRDVSGFPIYADLAKMPHLLVAGSTGTGKTIFLNSLILSLLYQPSNSFKSASPETLRFILVDPKRVEFPVYNKLPHLLCPVIYTASQTISVLKWLTGEMERRFDLLAEFKTRDIGSFNEKALLNGTAFLPFIILIIDELADLMAAKGREIEAGIVRLAQMARAVGIHLVVATQRPSVEVITGLIKANITSRVTFQVASQVDSRTVLDTAGAEKLLGSGDMLYVSAQIPKPKRIQGAYVSEKEVKRVVKDMEIGAVDREPQTGLEEELVKVLEQDNFGRRQTEDFYGKREEPLYEEAKKIVIEAGRASSSLLQRRLRIGYARAARLIDILEEKGVVGPADGAKPREIYKERENERIQNLPQSLESSESENGDKWEKI